MDTYEQGAEVKIVNDTTRSVTRLSVTKLVFHPSMHISITVVIEAWLIEVFGHYCQAIDIY